VRVTADDSDAVSTELPGPIAAHIFVSRGRRHDERG